MTGITHSVSLNDQLGFKPDDDIRKYLKDEFARIRAERKLFKLSPGWPPDRAIDQLVWKSPGQFIYASTVVKFVDGIYDDPRERPDTASKTRPVFCVTICRVGPALYPDTFATAKHQVIDLFTLIIALREPKIKFVCR
ncbi:hypothetical protein F5887DRAFT_924581 [Amanita rubescens]|nr:hypothetical protein F5887DRAFT_924581 [Amanita rubescens]